MASGTNPAAMAAALPPEDPPGEWSRFHGLRVGPNTVLSVSDFHPSSGVLVFPTTTHPAATSRATMAESAAATGPSTKAAEPWVVTKPAASSRSFTPSGIPASGPGSTPAATLRSMPAAAVRARSSSTATNAFSRGLCLLI